jgi:hypothetical protein
MGESDRNSSHDALLRLRYPVSDYLGWVTARAPWKSSHCQETNLLRPAIAFLWSRHCLVIILALEFAAIKRVRP